jgi:hypothetical protein
MYYPDLAHYEYDYGLDRPKPLRRTIGWLDAEHDYPKGEVELEIYVPGRNGIYVAPSLIYHYVVDHHYQPPAEFMEAVLQYSHLFEQSSESASLERRSQKPNPFSRMIRMVTNLLSS